MNVAYMLGSLNRGGTETLLLDVCSNLTGTGIEGYLYHRKGGSLQEIFKDTGVPMIGLTPSSAFGLLSYLLKLRKSFKLNSIDIIHAQQNIDALYAKLATVGTKRRVVQTFHGYDFNYGTSQKFLMYLSVLLSDASFFVSHTQRKYYLEKHKVFRKRKTGVIYNGIDFNRISNAAESTILEEYNVSKKTLKLAMVGNFVPVRDHMTICRFLNLLNQEEIDFMFFFIGAKDPSNPELFDTCVKYCSDHKLNEKVIFTGSRSDVPGVLKKMDAIIYSSNHDTFGIAVIEAMLSGKLVCVNGIPVFIEITSEGNYAHIYRTKDETDLLTCFLNYKKNNPEFKKINKDATTYVLNTFDIAKHINLLKSAYENLNKRSMSQTISPC